MAPDTSEFNAQVVKDKKPSVIIACIFAIKYSNVNL